MRYSTRPLKRHWPKRLITIGIVLIVGLAAATIAVRRIYYNDLNPVSSSGQTQLVTIDKGTTSDKIGEQLKKAGLIRSAWAFKLYVSSHDVHDALQAGTYSLSPRQSLPQIVAQLSHGKIASNLVTILPGQRLDQIRSTLINYGFQKDDVDAALDPAQYADNPALVDKPAGASLEGYIYPDSYQKTSSTTAKQIVTEALAAMGKQLTPDLRSAYAQEGLSTYQGITLASIVEQEVSNPGDRAIAAQVFMSRMINGMTLGSDVTAYYGSIIAGKTTPSLIYDSPYNTLMHAGLPPGPISNVDTSALQATAHPANTDYLYFVSGDDGVTHFSHTLDEHNAATAQYCHKLCSQ